MADPSYPLNGIDPEMVKKVNQIVAFITGSGASQLKTHAAAAQASSDTPLPQAKKPAPETLIPDPWEDV
ncbi:MAG: hypothetical protein DCF17_19195 [Shackletoniella antarctica]|jgi:hypothetical protein|uniref:Uncharacterized protein n=1 Tax=Shackletoniella antarctica TaxID=268115 RepID=A0A2W4XV20_9CYAN|nr:MAG: hypothetical protein DCF17_19195 [Shackletoniella antarctica]